MHPVNKALSTSLFLTLVDPLDVASLGRGSSATCRGESGELEVAGAAVSEFLLGTFTRKNEKKKDSADHQLDASVPDFPYKNSHEILMRISRENDILMRISQMKKGMFVVKFDFKQHTEMPMPFLDPHTKAHSLMRVYHP